MPYTFVCLDASINKDEYDDEPKANKNSASNIIKDVMHIMRMPNFRHHSYYNVDQSECTNYIN